MTLAEDDRPPDPTDGTPARALVEAAIAFRWPLLALGLVLIAAAWFPARQFSFDRSLENMFAPDDPLLVPYRHLKRTFGGNEIVLAVYDDPQLFDPQGAGLDRLERIASRLKAVPGVHDVLSLDKLLGRQIVAADNPIAANLRDLFTGYTHGADRRTVAAVCMLVPESQADRPAGVTPPPPRAATIDQLRAIMEALPATESLPAGMLAGEPAMVTDGFRYVEEDGFRLSWFSTALLAAVILLCFRSLRWVLVPVVVVQGTLLLTQGLLALAHLRLSMVSSMLAAIVTVVGVALVVHIIVRFREYRRSGSDPSRSLALAGATLAAPIFWSLLTDAVGFGSLLAARVGPVQDFGVMTAVGSLLVALPCLLLLPALILTGEFDADPQATWGEAYLDLGLEGARHWIESHPGLVGLATLLVTVAVSAGAARLEVESDFTKNFRPDSPIVRSYDYIETRLGGAGVWDVMLPAPATLDWAYLERVERLEQRLRREATVDGPDGRPQPGLTKVLSLADAVRSASPIDPAALPLPLLRDGYVDQAVRFMRHQMPAFTAALHAPDPDLPERYWLRIMLRAPERQTAAEKKQLIARVTEICRSEFPAAEVTGFYVLLANLIESILADQWITFGIAGAGVLLMLFLACAAELWSGQRAECDSWVAAVLGTVGKSLPLALIGLVPNVLPVLMVTGLLGWLGLKVNMGAAMIAAVSLGLSVDSSLHYLIAYLRARVAGEAASAALADAQRHVGRAMIFSTLALVAGFGVLCTSNFIPTVYFGALVTLTMLGGLLGNLLVLPLLLRWLVRW